MDVFSDVWDGQGSGRAPPMSWLDRSEARRLARYEASLGRDFDAAVFATAAEAAFFERRIGPANAHVVGNGVDLEYFGPAAEVDTTSRTIVFTGSMDYGPNRDAVRYFCTDILPVVRSTVEDARLVIVGRNPKADVRRLEREPGVTVTGEVPDVRPYLAGAALAVAPMRSGRGIQNKILEALAMGIPVVSTPNGLEGLADERCDGLLRADDAKTFAGHVTTLLTNPMSRIELGRAARTYVEAHHRWSDHGERLERVLGEVVACGRADGAR